MNNLIGALNEALEASKASFPTGNVEAHPDALMYENGFPVVNEYHMVRLSKPVSGIPGNQMKRDDPRRMRYYVRATSNEEAYNLMAARFPGEMFYDVAVTKNVAPLFREETEHERKAAAKQESKRRKDARKHKHTDGILVSELNAMMSDSLLPAYV